VTNEGNDTVAFASKLNSLKPNTKYYIRAYAANAIGITYGNTHEFTTLSQVPSIVTSTPKSITSTEATTGGTAIDDGGSAIISKGVCWNTTGNPTIADTSINHGNGNADFTSFLSGLTPGTKYYVRAWAKNSIGIGYGSTYTFNTTLKAPSLVTPTGGYLVGTNFELKWTCVTNATSYELQMSTSSSFTGTMWSLPISPGGLLYTTGYHSGVQGGTCTGFGLVFSDKMQSASPAGPGTYTFYWRVRALNSTTIGPWSTTTTSGYPNTFTFQK
jgi:FlaG/FlaF family flagellin (archaellin)